MTKLSDLLPKLPKFDKPFVAPAPQCTTCLDVGYISYDYPIHHKRFGKAFPCNNPECAHNMKQKNSILRQCGLSEREREIMTWDNLLDDEQARPTAKKVQKILKRGYGWVYIHGGTGKAKSLILKMATLHYAKIGVKSYYTSLSFALDSLRASYDESNSNALLQKRIKRLVEMPLLALDEFDKIKTTDWAREKRAEIMDRRYRKSIHEQTSVTLMASNEAPGFYEPYLQSRIEDGRNLVILMTGKDMRPIIKEQLI